MKNRGQQPSKATVSFLVYYNCRGKRHGIKSCLAANRAMFKMLDRKHMLMNKGMNKLKIINKDGFLKVRNTARTPSPNPKAATKILVSKLRMLELVLD